MCKKSLLIPVFGLYRIQTARWFVHTHVPCVFFKKYSCTKSPRSPAPFFSFNLSTRFASMYSRKTILCSIIAVAVGILAIGGLLWFDPSQQPLPQANHFSAERAAPASAQPAANVAISPPHTAADAATSAPAAGKPLANPAAQHEQALQNTEQEPGWPRQITDSRGTTTVLPQRPQRIVSLAPSVTQILRAIGADGALIAIPREGSDPSEDAALVRLPVYPSPSPEAVLSLRPDLLIGADITSAAAAERLRQDFNLPVIILSGNDYEGILADITRAGEATGQEAVASVLTQILSDQLATVQSEVAATHAKTGSPRPQALLFVGSSPDYAAGAGSYAANLLDIAGGENLALQLNQPWPQLSREFVLEANPQVLIFAVNANDITSTEDAPGRSEQLSASLRDHPLWRQLDAVRNDRIYVIDQSLINVPSPTVGEALNRLRAIIRDVQANPPQASK